MWVSESGGKHPKREWWKDELKAAFRRKEVLGASDEEAKKDVWKCTEKKRERLKGVYQSTYKVIEQFGRMWMEIGNYLGRR